MATLMLVPKPLSLGGRVAEVEAIAATLEALDCESITAEEREAISASLVEAITGAKTKIDHVSALLADYECAADSAEAECKRLAARRDYFARQAERLSDYVLAVLSASSLKKLDGYVSTLTARLNPVKVLIEDEHAVPSEFFRLPAPPAPVIDKAAVKDALQHGEKVPGARLARTTRLVRS